MSLTKNIEFNKEQIGEIITNVMSNGDINLIDMLEMTIEGMMKGERKLFLEETKENANKGNGYRGIKTSFNNEIIELSVPRDRRSIFRPFMLELIKIKEAEIRDVSFQLYSRGLSTKDVGEIFEKIYGKKYSKSGVSKLCEESRKEALEWINRPIDNYYPVIYIDAHYNSVRRENSIKKEAFYVIMGLKDDYTREVLTIENIPTESSSLWSDVIERLKERGLKQINLVVSDGLPGIENVIKRNFFLADVQLCTVHLKRELIKYVRSESKLTLASDLRELFRTNDSSYSYSDAKIGMDKIISKWGKDYPHIRKRLSSERISYYFTYLKYDVSIQSMIYTTNWIERLNKEFKRVMNIRNSMPNSESALALLSAVAIKMTKGKYSYPLTVFKNENKFKKVCN